MNLDRVLDDLAGVTPAQARPGKVSSPEGTGPDLSAYRNADCGQPLGPDVDALFGATKGYVNVKRERFEHRLMLWYKLQAFNNNEVAQLCGVTPQTVSNVTKQPWFQEAFCKLAAEMGKDACTTFLEGEVLPALQRTADMARNGESEAVRLSANRELLDRFLGKATVKIESKASVDVTSTVLDGNRLLEEQRRLDEQIRSNGLHLHGKS
jgi:hypothetical protein